MSVDQSEGNNNEWQQHSRSDRSGNPASQRNFSGGGGGGKGGDGSTTAPPLSSFNSGESFKKVISNARGAQNRVTDQNCAHVQPPLSRTPDVSVSTGPTVKPSDASASTSGATGPATPVRKPRKYAGILNKLTPQNFERLLKQLKQEIDNVDTLFGVVDWIFDKALMELAFVEMYANLCSRLAVDLPDFSEDNEKITFKRLLLNKCQEEFEREQTEANRTEEEGEVKQTDEQREEKRVQARRRMLGNIRLIGELYKKKMLTERIMHECIKKLFGEDYENPDEENIESLCKLMSRIGRMIDHAKAKEHMDIYFDMMSKFSDNMKLSSHIRFMLKDVIDLRKNSWQQRRNVEGPETMEEVHWDAAQEHQAQSNRRARGPNPNPSMRRGQGQPMDFGSKGSNLLPNPQTGYRGLPRRQHRGHGYYFENRTLLVPLWSVGYENITPGPPGGRARGMSVRGQEVIRVIIDHVGTLSCVVDHMFDKALMEPTLVEMFGNLFSRLAVESPDFSEYDEKITFKRLLVNKCQEEFERGDREQAETNRTEEEGEVKLTEEQREEKRVRKLGNIRLIGELYKKKMLIERIMHECIKKLFGEDYNNPDEENIESLCKLMSTIGGMIDHAKAKEHMDVYFDLMSKLSDNMKLSSRVRFMLKDVIDLRKNRWQQRREVKGPEKIETIHPGMSQERQGQPMYFGSKGSNLLPNPQSGYRGLPQQLRGYGNQDSRFKERHSFENRTLSVPLLPVGDDNITLGRQGGLARGISVRGQLSIRVVGGPNAYG